MTGYIIFMVVVLAVVFTIAAMVGKKRRDKLLSEGKIIMRKGDFYKNEQFFKSYINDQQAFFSALTAAARNTGICSVSGDYSSTVVYKGKTWTARLARHKSDDGSLIFAYALTEFDEYRGMPKNMGDFNIMLTAIEKVFLQFDPGTQITEKAIAFKSQSK